MKTVTVHGSGGEVMAHIGGGTLIRGKRQMILVTEVSKDESVPKNVREAFIGMQISTLFSKEQLGNLPEVPDGSRMAPIDELIEQLTVADKEAAAKELERMVREQDALVYVFEPSIFHSIQGTVLLTQ